MVLDNQKDTSAYSAFGQYMFGAEILIAPLWSDTTFYRKIYLPEGEWIDYFDETRYQGKQTITYYAPIDRVPIFIKAGSIIPMAPDNQRYIDEIKNPMTIQVYPEGNSSFELYEDDGESYDYERGIFSITKFTCNEIKNELILKKEIPTGKFNLQERDHVFCVHGGIGVKDVKQHGRSLPILLSAKEFENALEGWMKETNGKKLLWIKVKGSVHDTLEIKVLYE